MAEPSDGTQFTLLGADTALEHPALAAHYSYPADPRSPWVRANMIASLDGAATTGGRSGGLGGSGDRAVFQTLRELADVIVVGANTVRIENYSGAQSGAGQRAARQRRGQTEVPPIAVLTRTGRLARDARLFTRTEVPPLVLTCTDAVADTRSRIGDLAEVLDASADRPDSVDLPTALALLAERGLVRVLAEGGPAILGAFLAAGLIDELCLTLAPVLVGGPSARILSGPTEAPTGMTPRAPLTDADGYLYLRYVRGDDGGDAGQ
ncbi:pyrimidine reductase family protein [Mycolicibacterium vaccae]|uniref:pyrimidine reductase family protein n=1 Tax=Mycolicibacterium vaccae TaxID=1810 RepID=UPI003D03937A